MNNEPRFNAGLAYGEFQTIRVFYIIAALTAFAMSAYFVVGYFAGNLHILTWDLSQWMQALPSIGLVAVMTAYQFFLYSQGDTEGGKKATIIAVCVAVAFSLLSEVGQGMERDSIRMETKSQESPTYKAAVAALGNLSGNTAIGASPYAGDIAKAQKKYNQCLERLARGKEPHCNGSKGELESYIQQDAAWSDRASTASTTTATALLDKAKTLEKDESNYHPLVNFFREAFTVSGTVGSFLLSLTMISFFEYAFHYIGGLYAAARAKLMQHGYDVTRKLRQPPRRADGSLDTYSDKATSAPVAALAGAADSARQTVADYAGRAEQAIRNAPEAIATDMMQAQAARERLHQAMQTGADRIADTLESKPPMVDGFDMSRIGKQFAPTDAGLQPEQLPTQAPDISTPAPRMSVAATIKALVDSVQASGETSPEAIQAATTAAYSKLFNPADFDAGDLQKIASKIARDLKPATPSPSLPIDQAHGKTGPHNPALGTNEEHYQLPLHEAVRDPVMTVRDPVGAVRVGSDGEKWDVQFIPPCPGSNMPEKQANESDHVQSGQTDHVQSEKPVTAVPVQSEQQELEGMAKQTEIDLYPDWVSQVSAKVITPGARDGKRFISQATKDKEDKVGLTVQEMQRIWVSWQERAARDGVLTVNPKYAPGNRQPKYTLAG